MKNRYVVRRTIALGLGLVVTEPGWSDDATRSGAVPRAYQAFEEGLDLTTSRKGEKADWHFRLGGALGLAPDYPGAERYRLRFVPIIDIRYKDRLKLTYNRLSYAVYNGGGWQAGPFVKYKSGRTKALSPVVEGLGDLKATAEVGLFVRYRTNRTLFRADYRYGLTDGQGASGKVTFGQAIFRYGDFALALAASAKWLSKDTAQRWYGISADQAQQATGGLPEYTASAGFSGMSLDLIGRYKLNDTFRLWGLVRYGRKLGSTADSPLVQNKGQAKAGVGITVDF